MSCIWLELRYPGRQISREDLPRIFRRMEMFRKNYRHIVPTTSLFAFTVVFSLTFTSAAVAQEHAGRVHPELVGGQLMPSATQEQFGLLTLSNPEGTCSASMLNDYWAITAAHCVYSQKTGIQFTAEQITLSANWPSNTKSVQAVQVVSYSTGTGAANDIALLQTGLYDFVRSDLPGWPSQTDRQLESASPTSYTTVTAYGRGINVLASGSFPAATPTQIDGQYRTAQFDIFGITEHGATYSFSGASGVTIAGGDSGGPALVQEWDDPLSINRQLVWRLLGVHSRCNFTCVPGYTCGSNNPTNPWQWVNSVSQCTDAAVYPLQDSITQTIQQVPAPRQFIGTFGTTPPNLQPVWVYVISEDGTLSWYRQDTTDAAWQGPNVVGWGWQNFQDVIPVGFNHLYAVASDGTLLWYQHNGYNNGTPDWAGPIVVGTGWNGFAKIFSGGDGIIYAIQQDGTLLWYNNVDFATGGGTWQGPNVVGSGWGQFKDVFSMGQGIIYAVQQDGTLLWYDHAGYATGDAAWVGPFTVGSAWQQFSKILPAGNGVILAIRPDGTLLWYKHDNYLQGISVTNQPSLTQLPIWGPIWEGGVQIGSGWNGFLNVIALLPATVQAPH
jgi:hypothetical protein